MFIAYTALQELLRFLFREAKIHNAVLFFDECESLFESRENRTNPSLGIMLTEVSWWDSSFDVKHMHGDPL